MKIPKMANIDAACQIRNLLLTWSLIDELLYSEFRHLPENVDRKRVAYKVVLIDRLYNCNLKMDLGRVVDHIVSLNIDSDLSAGRAEVVDKVSNFPGKKALVFASKYCHFHRPDKFPMWDRFAAIGLGTLMNKNYLRARNYSQFKSDIDTLISKIGSQLSYKDLDEYLWLYGQKIENYEGASTEVEELSKCVPHLFTWLDPTL